jgi:hypothetical protein
MFLFKSEEERNQLLKDFDEKAKSLTISMKGEIPANTKIQVETVTIFDEIPTTVPNEEFPEDRSKDTTITGGKIIACYIRQPHIMTAVVILDKLQRRDSFSAGLSAWEAMVIPYPASCKEVEEYSYKLGLVGRLGFLLDGMKPDIKKN